MIHDAKLWVISVCFMIHNSMKTSIDKNVSKSSWRKNLPDQCLFCDSTFKKNGMAAHIQIVLGVKMPYLSLLCDSKFNENFKWQLDFKKF